MRFWIFYLLLHISFSALAPSAGRLSSKLNWLAAVAVVAVLSTFKTALLAKWSDRLNLPLRAFIYATTALWECSTAALYFPQVQAKLRCTTVRRCLLQALVPASVQFGKRRANLRTRGLYIALNCCAAALMFLFLTSDANAALKRRTGDLSPFLANAVQTALLLPALAAALSLFNVPAYFCSLLLAACGGAGEDFELLVIQPYGAVITAARPSEFWARCAPPPSSE
ncbi:hypothetical protein T484DRAFT_2026455 [Baffinella frigidus]|nr:hypothetical protein T484DRAFT_2026455 [Cryptophyta sp. CCMP2293]